MLLYWCSALFLIIGIVLLLGLHPLQWLPTPKEILQKITIFGQRIASYRKPSFKQKVDKILGKKKENVFARTMKEALLTLEQTGELNKARQMERNCIFFSLAGACIGLLLGNLFLVPVLGAGLYFIPLWIIKLSYSSYLSHLNEELEIALSQITSSYISSNNIVTAIKENLQYLNSPVLEAFEQFVITVESIDPNRERALEKLRNSFDSFIFQEWCTALIQCQRDNALKSTLQPHVSKFSRQKYMQEKQRTGQMLPFREYATMCAIVPVCMIGVAALAPDWFSGLITSSVGQLTIAGTVIVMILGINRAVQIAQPYQFRR